MKKLRTIPILLLLICAVAVPMVMARPTGSGKGGYDKWGYNRQANMFNGLYCNWALQKGLAINHDGVDSNDIGPANSAAEAQALLDQAFTDGIITLGEYSWASSYNQWGDTSLIMKWNDAWDSEPGAWITNHMWDSYIGDDGKKHHWEYFTKIVLVPDDAYQQGGYWYTADGVEIGPSIWGSYATILSVYNDPYDGYHGVEYLSPASPGFGYYKQ